VNVASERCCHAARTQLRALAAFDGLLIIPRQSQSFVISLSRNLSGRVVSLPPISKSAIILKSTIIRGPARKTAANKKAAAGDFRGSPDFAQPNRRLDVHLVLERGAPEHVVEGHRSQLSMHAAGETRIMDGNALIESGRMGGGVERA
jgi:hypothetical protein